MPVDLLSHSTWHGRQASRPRTPGKVIPSTTKSPADAMPPGSSFRPSRWLPASARRTEAVRSPCDAPKVRHADAAFHQSSTRFFAFMRCLKEPPPRRDAVRYDGGLFGRGRQRQGGPHFSISSTPVCPASALAQRAHADLNRRPRDLEPRRSARSPCASTFLVDLRRWFWASSSMPMHVLQNLYSKGSDPAAPLVRRR